MVILELKGVYETIERKGNAIQREFSGIADQLAALRRKWTEGEESERPKIVEEQERLKQKQHDLAALVNVWRDRLRAVESPRSEHALDKTLEELLGCGDDEIVKAVQEAQRLMAMEPEERAARMNRSAASTSNTPVGRLLERARTSYDLRNGGPADRQSAAVEFANRSGIAQVESVVAELEAGAQHADPTVADVALRTLIQILRFRASRFSELDIIYQAVQKLAKIKNPLVIPALIEILQNPRTGYATVKDNLVEGTNGASRLAALIALVEWRTREAQNAVRARVHDKDPQVAGAAERALEAFPGEWTGSNS